MNFLVDFFRGRHKPTKHERQRRGDNVAADAASGARDREIEAATAELEEARAEARRKRVEVALAARVARDVRRAVETTGQSFEVGIGQVARRIVGGD